MHKFQFSSATVAELMRNSSFWNSSSRKSGTLPFIFETTFFCLKFPKNVVFGHLGQTYLTFYRVCFIIKLGQIWICFSLIVKSFIKCCKIFYFYNLVKYTHSDSLSHMVIEADNSMARLLALVVGLPLLVWLMFENFYISHQILEVEQT